ncbi:MAG: vitamin B12 dependent methionine synthase [Anaerolineae bacterium]|nr:vitamin B12 dependent methionine synthase [Anaerolineae bacterium]
MIAANASGRSQRNLRATTTTTTSSFLEPVVMDDVAFRPDLERLMRKLRIKEESRHADQLTALVEEAKAIARPRAMYRVAYIDSRDESRVVIGSVRFHSRVLRVNLDGVHRVFPFAVTCGGELHEWMRGKDDLLVRYYADVISETALRKAAARLRAQLVRRYALGRTSTMSPGSLEDWPIQEQRPLFDLLGDPEETIGVRLTDSMLMIPSKSVSGIRFSVEKTFESCQLCQREPCPSRKAPYDQGLYERRYQTEPAQASARM